MKLWIQFCAVALFFITACKEVKTTEMSLEKETTGFRSFGDLISLENAIKSKEVFAKMKGLEVGDSLSMKFSATIKEVCSSKGCWMKLSLNETEETMVRFKNYGFFMPLDAQGDKVIVEGVAFVEQTSIEDLRHYAKDAGKPQDEIAKITTPEKTFAFEANGVLLKTK